MRLRFFWQAPGRLRTGARNGSGHLLHGGTLVGALGQSASQCDLQYNTASVYQHGHITPIYSVVTSRGDSPAYQQGTGSGITLDTVKSMP